jgi:hypothetical protein
MTVGKKYNNVAGTTSGDFTIGIGKATVGQYVIFAICNGANTNAHDKNNAEIQIEGVCFYDIKMVAENAGKQIVAKQLRGTINNTTITRIEDVFQEDFPADVTLTSDGTKLSVECVDTGTETHYTIYATLTRIV